MGSSMVICGTGFGTNVLVPLSDKVMRVKSTDIPTLGTLKAIEVRIPSQSYHAYYTFFF